MTPDSPSIPVLALSPAPAPAPAFSFCNGRIHSPTRQSVPNSPLRQAEVSRYRPVHYYYNRASYLRTKNETLTSLVLQRVFDVPYSNPHSILISLSPNLLLVTDTIDDRDSTAAANESY